MLLRENGPIVNIIDEQDLFAAFSLSRLVLHARELVTNSTVQKQCTKLVPIKLKLEDHGPFTQLVQDVGKLACRMRLYHALWFVSYPQSTPASSSDEVARYEILRLCTVTRIIYWWYLYALKKRNRDIGGDFDDTRNVLCVFGRDIIDPFPESTSVDGFNTWLADGKRVVEQAGLLALLCRPTPSIIHTDHRPQRSYRQYHQQPDHQMPNALMPFAISSFSTSVP